MYWMQFIDGFHFDDQLPLNQKIDSQVIAKGLFLVIDLDWFLRTKRDTAQSKLDEHGPMIQGLQQPRPKVPVYFHRRTDYRECQWILFFTICHFYLPSLGSISVCSVLSVVKS